jgi:apolipoprotein N-acyltransferase
MQRFTLAIASGVTMWLAFPSHNVWVLAPVGVALLALATRRASPWQGAGLGMASGLACFLPLLSWSGVYVGAVPWVALAVLESCYIALLGSVCAFLQRGPSLAGRGRVRPVVVALAWVCDELLRDTTPFGGFPWGRLAFSQADSPLAGLASLGGAPTVTFGVALVGGLLAAGIGRLTSAGRHPAQRHGGGGRRVLAAAPCLVGALVAMSLPILVGRPTNGVTARFLAVQGNVPRPGLDFNAERRAVLDNHAKLTQQAASSVRAGTRSRPALVVWPENASDIDPLRNADADLVIQEAVDAIDAPIVVGAVLNEPAPSVSNASLLYLPGKGLTARYVKQHPVPFAEYIPFRSFFRRLDQQVDLVRSDFVAGGGPVVFRVPAPRGATIAAGPIICFEVAYDALMRDTVNRGANVLLVQTNNATFGFTDESAQQLAISRIRAVEHGRSIVHVSTVGVSAMITPDGTAHQATSLFTPAVLAAELPLRAERTLADRLGAWPDGLAAGGLALMLVLPGMRRLRR